MNRLKKKADTTNVLNETEIDTEVNNKVNDNTTEELSQETTVIIDILNRINNVSDDIKSCYYSLLDNLNALNKDYPNVYNELKLIVKLPTKQEISDVAEKRDDMHEALQYLTDKDFLNGILNKNIK